MPATIFSGTKVKTLKDILSLNGGADVLSSTTDPTSVAVSANAGSMLLNTSSGLLYRKTDNGSTTNWILIGDSGVDNLAVRSETSTYSVVVSDSVILCSGSSFTLTLFASSGNTGKVLTLKKTDASLSNIFTIDANGAETIDGALTVKLATQDESISIISDGTNWRVLERSIPSIKVSYTPTIAPWTTNFTTEGWYKRDGDSVVLSGFVERTGALTGTDALTFSLPSGLVIDTAKLPSTPTNARLGNATARQLATATWNAIVQYSSTTVCRFFAGDGTNMIAVTKDAPFAWGNNDQMHWSTDPIPVVDWEG